MMEGFQVLHPVLHGCWRPCSPGCVLLWGRLSFLGPATSATGFSMGCSVLQVQLLLQPAIRVSSTRRRCHLGSCCYPNTGHHTICTGFCRRCYDICSRRGANPGVETYKQYRFSYHGRQNRICGNDGARISIWLVEKFGHVMPGVQEG